MKIWLSLSFLPFEVLPDLVAELERVGIEGVTVSDHVCVPANMDSTYPYTGRTATLPVDTQFPDPIALVATLGARTTTLRFMTHVLLAALRHPIVLAKELATVSALNGGRLDIGIGVGWMREEFDAVGVRFDKRGAITDEVIDVLRLLWTGEVVEYSGNHFAFDPLVSRPTPAENFPLFGSGYSAPAMRRAARLDGWLGVTPSLDELSQLLDQLREARGPVGSQSDNFTVRTGIKGTLTDELVLAVDRLGVDALIVTPHQLASKMTSPDDIISRSVIELSRLVELTDAEERRRGR